MSKRLTTFFVLTWEPLLTVWILSYWKHSTITTKKELFVTKWIKRKGKMHFVRKWSLLLRAGYDLQQKLMHRKNKWIVHYARLSCLFLSEISISRESVCPTCLFVPIKLHHFIMLAAPDASSTQWCSHDVHTYEVGVS